jgi:hypothetical protein
MKLSSLPWIASTLEYSRRLFRILEYSTLDIWVGGLQTMSHLRETTAKDWALYNVRQVKYCCACTLSA